MSDFGNTPFPRVPLISAAVLVALVLMATTTTRLTGMGKSSVPPSAAVAERDLRFEDQSDGSIQVIDARQQAVIASVHPGTGGFLRGTLRGLARERHRRNIGPEQAFQLTEHADGRLTLTDPATARTVDLESFGPTNEAVFASFIAEPSQVAALNAAAGPHPSAPSVAVSMPVQQGAANE